jgi:molybdopterin converting factor subunit 1
MRVRVKLFAAARELAGVGELSLEVPDGATVADVELALLNKSLSLEKIVAHARWAVDAVFVSPKCVVNENSEIALIPPVSGG